VPRINYRNHFVLTICRRDARDDDPAYDLAYPDLVEDHLGRIFIFEAHEGALRCNDAAFVALGGCGVGVHAVSAELVAGLRRQMTPPTHPHVTQVGLQVELNGSVSAHPFDAPMFADPRLASSGLTVELWLKPSGSAVMATKDSSGLATKLKAKAANFLDCRSAGGAQLTLAQGSNQTAVFVLRSPASSRAPSMRISISSDPGSLADARASTHLAAVLDGGPPLVRWVVDGIAQDGGTQRLRGWAFYNFNASANHDASDVNVADEQPRTLRCRVGTRVKTLRIYSRQLTTSQLIENYRADRTLKRSLEDYLN
jgi:hypothetical protein